MSKHTVGKYTFQWTSDHMSKETATALRYQYDELGSRAASKLQEFARVAKKDPSAPFNPHQIDMYELLRQHHSDDPILFQFWEETHFIPEWVDWEQIERGQKFFYRYALGNIVGFALQAFMGENTTAHGISEVLIRTGGFSTRVLFRRLLETFQLLLQVTESLEAIKPGGSGHVTTIRVRLLHSMVRERIMNLEKTRGKDYFDIEELGYPINTTGSIHSIATFCCSHSWLQLPFMGVYPSQQESADYIALFRYVAHVIGTPAEYFETVARSKVTMESMLVNDFRLNDTSYVVAHNFIQCLTDIPPYNISEKFIEAGTRALNGNELCDELGLGYPGFCANACFRGLCWLMRALAFLQHAIPPFDRLVTNFFKTTLHDLVIHSKKGLGGGSKLHFKHVPQVGKHVGRENKEGIFLTPSILARPVEGFFFCIFLLSIVSPVAIMLVVLRKFCF